MRKIYVADSACTDEALMWVADQNPLAALVWPWFLLSLDDWGRGSANPRQLRARLFPENTLVTAELLSEALDLYAQAGLVTLYEVGARRFVAIAAEKWFRYQTHIRSEKRTTDGSRFPAPTADDARDRARPREDARTSHGCCASPSALPPFCPSTLPPVHPSENSSSSDDDGRFLEFWERYPRKTHKQEALRQWRRLSDSERTKAIAAAGHLAVYAGWTEREFIAYPARFLGPSRLFVDWADGIPEGERPEGAGPSDDYCPFCGGLITPDEDLTPHCSACHRRFTP